MFHFNTLAMELQKKNIFLAVEVKELNEGAGELTDVSEFKP